MPVAFAAGEEDVEAAPFAGPCTREHPPRPARESDREVHRKTEERLRVMITPIG